MTRDGIPSGEEVLGEVGSLDLEVMRVPADSLSPDNQRKENKVFGR